MGCGSGYLISLLDKLVDKDIAGIDIDPPTIIVNLPTIILNFLKVISMIP